ncbi:SpoIIE family protein phosphatase [Streptomyces sp. NBC_00120]|uniref:SpoIIE family protein phosphatase n=1 Tax=Streptomyces sp. NBC_00119 TaxID=2975659 RepID=A0AAU1U1J4_9ACTN|nr:SpoIIE family protein phosphatase [Streptomyces sp. NBC_00120]MCX5323261.1 SpoIIE family protein phosphatase [Streptomyces sp. NBC_00120]
MEDAKGPQGRRPPTSAPPGVLRQLGTERAAALLDVLFAEAAGGLYVLDSDLRSLRFDNSAPATPAPGDTDESVSLEAGLSLPHVQRALRTSLATGERVRDLRCLVNAAHGERRKRRALSLSAYPLRDRDRQPLGLAVTVTDITRRERAEKRLELLERADSVIGSSLDVFSTAQELAESAIPGFADAAAVDVLDAVLHGDAPAPGPLLDPITVRRAGFATAGRADGRGVHEVGCVRVMRQGRPYAYVLADLTPRVVNDLGGDDSEAWLSHDPDRATLFRSAGVHSLLVVPLAARGVVLGLAAFYRAGESEPFDEADADVAGELAARAALSLDNARLYTRERTLARIAQRELLPRRVPATRAVETAHTYLPVAAGGAWFDVIPLSGARVALVAGDVRGSGLRAATAMGQVRTAVHAFAAMDLEPAELLTRLHELLAGVAMDRGPTEFPAQVDGSTPHDREMNDGPLASCLYVVYDPVTLQCEAVSAGHPPPVVTAPQTAPYVLDLVPGPALGRGAASYRSTTVELPTDSVLALFNHGLVPGTVRDDDRLPVLMHHLDRAWERPLQQLCDTLVTAVLPDGPEDDTLLLLARTRALGPHDLGCWTLPHDTRSASRARRLVAGRLAEWGLDDLIPGAELIASELVTNAVRYAEGTIGLRLIRDDVLTCEVTDSTGAAPHLRLADESDEGGRGLYLVGTLARRWGTRHSARGKTIWAELPNP